MLISMLLFSWSVDQLPSFFFFKFCNLFAREYWTEENDEESFLFYGLNCIFHFCILLCSLLKDRYFQIVMILFLVAHAKYEVFLPKCAAAAKSLQSCPTLCDPRDGSPPGSAVPGILQARTLEWVAISFSNAWKWKVKVKSLSRV